MKQFGPLTWISFSLTCLTLGILLAGDTLVGLSSGSLSSIAVTRRTQEDRRVAGAPSLHRTSRRSSGQPAI